MKAKLHVDGGARPKNPGYAGFACVVDLEDGRHEVLNRFLGRKTNNEAEYIGLITGIKYANFLRADELVIYTDSKLIFNQVSGNWYPKDFRMRAFCHDAQKFLEIFFPQRWKIKWCKRDKNTEADELCTAAIFHGANLNPFTPSSIKQKRGEGRIIDPFRVSRVLSE